MKSQRVVRVFLAVFAVCVLLTGTVFGQPSEPPRAGAESSLAEVRVGASGLSYRYASTLGETNVPYLADLTHLNRPIGIAIDPSSGDFYITEQAGRRLLRYQANKTNTLAMGFTGLSSQGDTSWNDPRNVALAPDGHIWVADNSRITEYEPDGSYIRDVPEDDPGAQGSGDYQFRQPESIAFDNAGHMFVADRYNQRVQVFNWAADTAPVYRTSIGATGVPGNDLTHLNEPSGVAARANGDVYISDTNNNRVLSCPYNSTSGTWSCSGLTSALNQPKGLAYAAPNILYIMDNGNGRIMKCTGSTCAPFPVSIWGTNLAVDSSGNVYVTREWDCVVERVSADGTQTSAFFGARNACYLTDTAHFNQPRVEIDMEGNILVLEEAGQRLSKFSPTGVLQWSKGTPGQDNWTNSTFNWPHGLDTDKYGNIYVADSQRVQIFNKGGVYQTTIGERSDPQNRTFEWVSDVGVDPNNGTIYAVDSPRARVLVFNSSGTPIGIIQTWGPENDHFSGPLGVEVDANSNVYVTDWGTNYRVLKFNSSREYQKTFGIPGVPGSEHDQLSGPDDVFVDGQGRVTIVDMSNNRAQIYDAEGAYLATVGGEWGEGNGQFQQLSDVSIGRDGSLYTSELFGCRIQKFLPGYPGWAQKNVNGFGLIKGVVITALEEYDNQLFAAQANWEEGTSSLWRSQDGQTWTLFAAPGVITDEGSKIIIDLQVFNNQLYAATGWGEQYGRLWRYDGATWERVLEQELSGFLSMAVFNNTLYAGDGRAEDGPGVSIWYSTTGSEGSWNTNVTGGNGHPNNISVQGLHVFQDRLFAIVANNLEGMEIWRMSTNGQSWERVLTGGRGDSSTQDTGGLEVFNGYLYAGARNDETGGKIFRTNNGATWETVVSAGFGDPAYIKNVKIDALYAYRGRIYAVTTNEEKGAEIWSSSDGVDWQANMTGGFGDPANSGTFWSNGTTVFQDRLYVTMANVAKGAQVWGMLDTIFLPMVRR